MSVAFESSDGRVLATELAAGRRRLLIEPWSGDAEPITCETRYPDELIRKVLTVRGLTMLRDELARDEDPTYVERYLRYAMFGYVEEECFADKRLLDFGCGAGASTMILFRMLPDTEIVAVDLFEDQIAVAKARAKFYGAENIRFLVSPGPEQLPPDIGMFDFVSFSAVFEHLLPSERPILMAQVWSVLCPGGILFVNQTPHRWFPHEFHTTGLPLVNYLPRSLAHRAANRLSRRVGRDESWEALLRKGIRGATETDVLNAISSNPDARPVLLTPSAMNLNNKVDLWYASSMAGNRPWRSKQLFRLAFKAISRVTGHDFTPCVDLAILKT
jgi:2-polyprenyl-3-methyl-5-hydroxy-6-metoxy-1,4-benzoquinol methylase